jgi:peptidoglycan L-alanyl-D-glutamate endopeptidase CwlK
MPHFSDASRLKLETCDIKLQVLFNEVVKRFDCTIIEGHRGQERQDELFNASPRRTKVPWPNSRHNSTPSKAVDVAPCPVDWNDRDRFHYFAGYVQGVASQLGIAVRWGGDWNDDTQVRDNSFDDLPHFELEES